MTKSEIETAKRELDHALGAFEEWSVSPDGWHWAAIRINIRLFERNRLATVAFGRALNAACTQIDCRTREEAVLVMRRLAPVFLELLIEREE